MIDDMRLATAIKRKNALYSTGNLNSEYGPELNELKSYFLDYGMDLCL